MDRRELALLIPEPIRRFPVDLAAVIFLTLLAALFATIPGLRETPLRIVFGLPLVLFLPGYAFIAALFPEAGASPKPDGRSEGRLISRSIDPVERIALSLGMSLAFVPFVALAINFAGFPLGFGPVLVSLSTVTLLCTAVATYRRWQLPAAERFVFPYRSLLGGGRADGVESEGRRLTVLNVGLGLSILAALSTMAYAVAVPRNGEQFTDFHLLTQDEDGDLTAANYPDQFELDEPQSLYVSIQNQEGETVDYTVVVQLERVEVGDDDASVTEREELDRFGTTVEDGDTWRAEHSVAPTMVGEDLRLTYLLYMNEPPSEPSRENAYRDLHIWIDVEESTG
jgi:uncharacterized membrane protein